MNGSTTEEVDGTAEVRTPPMEDDVGEVGIASKPLGPSPEPMPIDSEPKPKKQQDQPTYGRAWTTRTSIWKKAAMGNVGSFIKQQAYFERKKNFNIARKEWVKAFGMAKAIPESIWPKMPDGSRRAWVPDDAWLTDEQRCEPWCKTYTQEFAKMNPTEASSSSARSSWQS